MPYKKWIVPILVLQTLQAACTDLLAKHERAHN